MDDARSAIENVVNAYGYAFDFGDFEMLDDCFTPDAEASFAGTGDFHGRAAIVAELRRRREQPLFNEGAQPYHLFSNTLILSSDGREAKVHSCWVFYLINANQAPQLFTVGDYDDVFVKDGGRWRIRHRIQRQLGRV